MQTEVKEERSCRKEVPRCHFPAPDVIGPILPERSERLRVVADPRAESVPGRFGMGRGTPPPPARVAARHSHAAGRRAHHRRPNCMDITSTATLQSPTGRSARSKNVLLVEECVRTASGANRTRWSQAKSTFGVFRSRDKTASIFARTRQAQLGSEFWSRCPVY